MKKIKKIRGSGGGGDSSSSTPVEADNTLKSKAYAQFVDLICEGAIQGLADGLKSVYFDETPLQNANGTKNFSAVLIQNKNGTQNQTFLPGFSFVENDVSVGLKVTHAVSLTRQVTDANVNAVRVRLVFPQMTYVNQENGNLNGNAVSFKIQRQTNGGGYVDVYAKTLSGKSVSRFQRDYRVPVSGTGPWDIRVVRVSADSVHAYDQSDMYWDGYVEIIETKLSYPNSALVGVRIDASQFSAVPRRAYDMKLLRIRVPSNATARADGSLTYSGTWDGTFQTIWSANPAWVFYDLITNDRYGLGAYIEADQIDKWALYTIGRYCDALVPTGFGGTEPRFTCNVYIQAREEAFKVIQDFCSIFRGMCYWGEGTLTAVQDAPADASYIYTNSNVVDGRFTYQGASAKARHTVALVSWNDPSDFYKQKVEYVEDVDAIARFGIIETEITAIGCTSRGQAHRLGKWLLYSEQNETETVSFSTGIEGAVARPGDIINVADYLRANKRFGGRISAATTNKVTLDRDVDSTDVAGGTISVLLPNGTVENKTVQSIVGRLVTISGTFSATPAAQSIWGISSTSVAMQTFRVLSVTESEGVFDVTAIAHDPNKFAAVENNIVLEERSISSLSIAPAAPNNLAMSESLYQSQSEVRVKLTVSWDKVEGASGYIVSYTPANGNTTLVPQVSANDFDILDVQPGVYSARVVAVNPLGKKSVPSETNYEVIGKTAAPVDVSNFSLIPTAGRAELSWDKATDLDVIVGGTVAIRWTPLIVGQVWKNAVEIVPSVSGTTDRVSAPLLSGTYMAKFIDSSGVSSENEALIVTTIPAASTVNIIQTLAESPSFAGTKTDVEIDPTDGALQLSSAALLDDYLGLIDDLTAFDTLGNIAETGTYLFANSVDLGAVYTSKVTASIQVETVSVFDYIDTRPGNIEDWTDLDGTRIDDAYATLYLRTTEDNPAGTPTWTTWKPFFISDYKARAYQFKLVLSTDDTTHNIRVRSLSVVVDMPERNEGANAIVSGAGTYTVTYTYPYYATPAVGVSAENLATGDYYVLANKTKAGFDITFKNSAGTNISRTFDWLARGYGRAVA